MPDFLVTLNVELYLKAKSQQEAEERAESLTVEAQVPHGARWKVGHIEALDVVSVDKLD